MNRLQLIGIAVLLILGLAACNRENVGSAPEVVAPDVSINYDGNNLTAPQLPAGTYEGGIRIESDLVNTYNGFTLKEIHFYIATLPSTCAIKIYQGSNQDAPDALIYSEIVTNDLSADSWNVHTLQRSVILTDQDIWVAVQFSHTEDQRTLGCDPGPAVTNGDWVRDASGWQTLRQLANTININWNVRAIVTP